jgi:hypothetical protein
MDNQLQEMIDDAKKVWNDTTPIKEEKQNIVKTKDGKKIYHVSVGYKQSGMHDREDFEKSVGYTIASNEKEAKQNLSKEVERVKKTVEIFKGINAYELTLSDFKSYKSKIPKEIINQVSISNEGNSKFDELITLIKNAIKLEIKLIPHNFSNRYDNGTIAIRDLQDHLSMLKNRIENKEI